MVELVENHRSFPELGGTPDPPPVENLWKTPDCFDPRGDVGRFSFQDATGMPMGNFVFSPSFPQPFPKFSTAFQRP
jgi:hypothetical protein